MILKRRWLQSENSIHLIVIRLFAMKRFLLTFILLTLTNGLFAQLDPIYFGTYMNQDHTAAFTVYTMDEIVDDCFVVEYETYKDGDITFSNSGYGHCDGDNGHLTLIMENMDKSIEVGFEQDKDGLRVMKVYAEDGTVQVFFEFNGDDLEQGAGREEIYYARPDGSELIIYAADDPNKLGFSIFYNAQGKCVGNGIEGEMTVVNNDFSVFEFNVNDKCRVEFQLSTDSINIVEEGCSGFHGAHCGQWSGLYILNR